ncbi:MAG: tetratricopeptide repeat protein [Candidatus Omnitrophica bacterium]|nr:tetratricopeptide repeat protein [Candidatus Omnitrophota bacterium]
MTDAFRKFFRSGPAIFLGLLLVVLAAYSFMLGSPFKTLDDDFSIVKNAEIRSLAHVPQFFRSTYFKADQDYYRPLVYVTYALEYHFFGLNYFYYNLDNVLLHGLNAWLVFILAGLLFAGPPAGKLSAREAAYRRNLSAAAALLFAVHPVHWEAVGNVSGRAILLCAFFVLSGLICFLRFHRGDGRRFLAAAVVFYVLGLASKESAGVLILTVTAWVLLTGCKKADASAQSAEAVGAADGLRGRTGLSGLAPAKLARDWAWLVPFGIVAGAYLALRHALGISQMFPWPSKTTMVLGLVTFLKGILIYFRIFLLPIGLHFDRGLLIFKVFHAPGLWLTLVAWALLAAAVWRFRRRLAGLPLFCLAWFFVELLPVSQIVTTIGVYPGAISLAEHFVYVASVPAFVLLVYAAGGLGRWAEERRLVSPATRQGAFAGLFLFFFIMLVQQNLYASNEFAMLRDSLAKDPLNSRLQYSMGMVYVKARDYDRAVEHFRRAVELHACNYGYHIALGKALTDQGDLLAAAREYDSIPPRKDVDPLLNANRQAVYRQLAAQYARKVEAAPADPALHFALGVFYARSGDQPRALTEFRRTVELKPDHRDALHNVAVTSEGLGDADGARAAWFRLADDADPGNSYREQARAALARLVPAGQ